MGKFRLNFPLLQTLVAATAVLAAAPDWENEQVLHLNRSHAFEKKDNP
jgi:hypothetical protein